MAFEETTVDVAPAPHAFLLTGIPGAGKTSVARALASRFPVSAHIEGDEVGALVVAGRQLPAPEPNPEADRQLLLRARNVALLVGSFVRAGVVPVAEDVVVRRAHLEYYVASCPVPLQVVVLAPAVDVALARDARRDKHVAGTWAFLDAALRRELEGVGMWLDTSSLTIAESVDAILDAVAP